MNKQVMVVGLGQFGMSLARALEGRGVEVLAVDLDKQRVRSAAQFATEALCFDATDEEALAQTSPERRDACVCAIGDDATEASIICTALLKQLGARHLVGRVNDDLHERILRLVGADVVVNPEREFGERFANLLLHEGVLGELPLGGDLVITELETPQSFVGRTLIELSLPKKYGVTLVALRHAEAQTVLTPDPHEPLSEGDILLVVSKPEAVAAMLRKVE